MDYGYESEEELMDAVFQCNPAPLSSHIRNSNPKLVSIPDDNSIEGMTLGIEIDIMRLQGEVVVMTYAISPPLPEEFKFTIYHYGMRIKLEKSDSN